MSEIQNLEIFNLIYFSFCCSLCIFVSVYFHITLLRCSAFAVFLIGSMSIHGCRYCLLQRKTKIHISGNLYTVQQCKLRVQVNQHDNISEYNITGLLKKNYLLNKTFFALVHFLFCLFQNCRLTVSICQEFFLLSDT